LGVKIMLKVAIVGCGRIADAHASQILRVGGCEIVAVCDSELLMAKQLCERFPVKRYMVDLAELLSARPDVVHITTPAESHFDIAGLCLEHGCHVYVEKPFTLYAHQAQEIIDLAEKKQLKLTVGHSDQFSHAARRMRTLVNSGYLGGLPVHMESYYCYDLSDPSYARALMADKNHWVRKLPGKLLHNIISHGVARIAEFLTTDSPGIIAHGFVSPLLRQIDEHDIVDELRVIINEKDRTTAYFTFSSQMRPSMHEFRIYGPKNGLILDQDHETVIRLRGEKYKSYADKFLPPVSFAKQQLANAIENAKLFLKRDFHMDSGIKYLIEAFYRSIRENAAVPIPYREILLTSRIMDAIFDQLLVSRQRQEGSEQRSAARAELVASPVASSKIFRTLSGRTQPLSGSYQR
jgi:predicted dehydrogenase